jgi:nicotinamide-nucleotide amidase
MTTQRRRKDPSFTKVETRRPVTSRGVAAELKALLLQEPRWTLATAESLTSGQVQARCGGISGASNYFLGGVTAYTIAQKVKLLGVDRAEAKRVNAVSAEIAEQMAQGACTLFGSDLAVATTGYAEPAPGEGVEEPFAYWAIAHRARSGHVRRSGRVECPGAARLEAQGIVAEAVLAELVAYLREARAAGRGE